MTEILRWPVFRYSAFIIGALAAAFLLLPGLRGNLLSAEFLPHATCYLQNPRIIWLHASSDTIIGLSYLAISSTLGYLVYRARQDIPFHWMFLAFGLFIVTCGFTHFMEVWTVWRPVYWLAGYVKLVTAMASLATAIVLPPVVPKVRSLIRAAKLSEERQRQLESANRELEGLYRRVKELDELRSQFFANVSHELRTPLTLILSPVRMLQTAPNLDRAQREQLQLVERNASLLLKQVNELLDAAKLEAGKMGVHYVRTDLVRLFGATIAQFEGAARERGMRLKADLPEAAVAELDPEKVERVLLNLLSNALKFTPEGGAIRCSLRVDGDQVRFSVADSGLGIPPEKREMVFERFRQLEGSTTRKHSGTGLGLSISREFVLLHSGKIWVETAPEGGAEFVVEIPARAKNGTLVNSVEAARANATDAASYVPGVPLLSDALTQRSGEGKAHVLVVEDNADLSRFLRSSLQREYNLSPASNGREALRRIEEAAPDAIVSDVMMPEMSGEDLLRELRSREQTRDIPVIFLTARADEEFKIRVLRSGAHDYLPKPFSIEELRARLANAVALSRTRQLLQAAVRGKGTDLVDLVNEVVRQKRALEKSNSELEETREELQAVNKTLEARVLSRTSELAEANDDLRAFTSSASHDMRAPLRTIRGMAEILVETLNEGGKPEELRQYADRIVNGARRMDALLTDLLTYATVGRGEIVLGSVSLAEIVQQTLTDLEADITLRNAEIERRAELAAVRGSESLVKQVVANFLGNAIKYVPNGRVPRLRIFTEERGGMVRLWVEDNGVGIPPEYQEAIFEPFKRLHSGDSVAGTGLGLAIAMKAVRRMGGNMGVESVPGEGSRFWAEFVKVS